MTKSRCCTADNRRAARSLGLRCTSLLHTLDRPWLRRCRRPRSQAHKGCTALHFQAPAHRSDLRHKCPDHRLGTGSMRLQQCLPNQARTAGSRRDSNLAARGAPANRCGMLRRASRCRPMSTVLAYTGRIQSLGRSHRPRSLARRVECTGRQRPSRPWRHLSRGRRFPWWRSPRSWLRLALHRSHSRRQRRAWC